MPILLWLIGLCRDIRDWLRLPDQALVQPHH